MTEADNVRNGPNGLPSITSEITINGNGAETEINLDDSPKDEPFVKPAGAQFRIFHIASGANVTLNDLTISGGFIGDEDAEMRDAGGGIRNHGTAVLNNATITKNYSYNFWHKDDDSEEGGGGITNFGIMYLTNVTVSGNKALESKLFSHAGAGGMFSCWCDRKVDDEKPEIELTNVTITDNEATRFPGGLNIIRNGKITNTIVAGNRVESPKVDKPWNGEFPKIINLSRDCSVYRVKGDNTYVDLDNKYKRDYKEVGVSSGGNNLIGGGNACPGLTDGVKRPGRTNGRPH